MLGGFAGVEISFAHPAAGHRPGEPGGAGSVYKPQYVTFSIPTGLGQKGHVQHGGSRAGVGHLAGLPEKKFSDFGMDQLFEVSSLGRPLQATGRTRFRASRRRSIRPSEPKDLRPPSLAGGFFDTFGLEHFVCRTVGIEQSGSKFGQLRGDEALGH